MARSWRRAPAVVEKLMKPLVSLILAVALAAPLSKPVAAQAAKKEPSAGQLAARERQKQCGAEWKQATAAKTVSSTVRSRGCATEAAMASSIVRTLTSG